MNAADLLVDSFVRVHECVHDAVEGLSVADLRQRIDADANPIGWLAWHIARVQDDHVIEGAAGGEQVWTSHGWAERLDVPYDVRAHGYGQTSEEVGGLTATADELLGYFDAVHEHVVNYVRGLSESDLDRVVDDRWDPPVTLGVRLISVISDSLQHVGQAAYVRGVISRD
jgi:Protein of unknown function (DUF664)